MIPTAVQLIVILIFIVSKTVNSIGVLNLCSSESAGKSISSEFKSVLIPGRFMSDYQDAEFRLEPHLTFSCTMSYEIININLTKSKGSISDSLVSNLSQYQMANFQMKNLQIGNNETFFIPEAARPSIPKMNPTDNFTEKEENNTEIDGNTCERKLNRFEVQFTSLGFLYHSGEWYHPADFCIQSINEPPHDLTMRKCSVDCSNDRTPCIPLCCHLHEHVDMNALCCQEIAGLGQPFQPPIYDKLNQRLSLRAITAHRNAEKNHTAEYNVVNNDGVVQVLPHYVTFKYLDACPDGMEPQELFFNENGESDLNTRIQIKNNGKAMYVGDDREWHSLESYCVAGIVNGKRYRDDLHKMTAVIKYCMPEEVPPQEVSISGYLLVVLFATSSVFLLATVVVYALLWEKQNIHGWTIVSFVTSEFFLYFFLALSYSLSLKSYTSADEISETSLCKLSGTFSWLTMVNLDLWWTFKSLTPVSERSKGKKRFALYMAFGWGLPLVVISVALSLQAIYTDNTSNIIIPDYGNRVCFIAKHAKGVYLYYILGGLLLVNSLLISLTFLTIYKFKKSARMATSSSSKSKEQSFKLFFKLVIVMGVTWILEFVSWLVENEEYLYWVFIIFDILILSQAVATFMIFVCKRKILNQLEQAHPSLTVIVRPILNRIGAPATSNPLSSFGKQTRSTTAGSMSTSHGSRHKSVASKRSSSSKTSV